VSYHGNALTKQLVRFIRLYVKLNLSLCLTKYNAMKTVLCLIKHHTLKTYGGVEL